MIVLQVGGCQNYGPFLGPYYNTAPIRDPNFDNHPGVDRFRV